jgi:hypothetical protein
VEYIHEIWIVRSLYRSSSLKTVPWELAEYKLHLVGVQEVRGSRVSSVSIVSDYGLDERTIGVRFTAGQRIFPLTSVSRSALRPTQPRVQLGTGGLFPRKKRGRGVTLTTHPHLVPRSRMSCSYASSPPKRHYGV